MTKNDYISREAAIEKIRVAAGCAECDGNSSVLCVCDFCDVYNAIRLIKGLPAADVEPRRHWIPRSERMPEVDDYYLCEYHFDGHKKKRITTFFCYATDPNPHFQDENHYGLKVTHWMPLPELPEEEQ